MFQTQLPESEHACSPSYASAEVVDASRVSIKAIAAQLGERERLRLALGFGYRMVAAWWDAIAANQGAPALRQPPTRAGRRKLVKAEMALADDLGASVARLEPCKAAYQLGLTYTSILPAKHRSLLGIYYTPPALVERLVAQATQAGAQWSHARVLDPACGGGAFLAPVAKRILKDRSADVSAAIRHIASSLRGYDVDPFGAYLSQVAVDATLLSACIEAGLKLPTVVSLRDSLRRHSRGGFDIVIGNPPYGRVKLGVKERESFKRSLYGHANLYGLFTDVALRSVKHGGLIAYVTPTSFLAGEYFKNLRMLLAKSAPPLTIDFLGTRRGIFDDVLQETLLAVYRRGDPPGSVVTYELTSSRSSGVVASLAGSVNLPGDASKPWLLPRRLDQAPLVVRVSTMGHRLKDWGYRVRTGPLVWNRHRDQLAHEPGNGRFPLIWAEAVTPDGRFVFRANKKNHAPYFRLRHGDDWLAVERPCVLLQRTTAKEQQRRLIAAPLPGQFVGKHRKVIVENHLNMLVPMDNVPEVSPEVLAVFLNSAAADRVFRCVSGSVAVSAYELEALPLPSLQKLKGLNELIGARAGAAEISACLDRMYQ